MTLPTLKELAKAGAHFGHSRSRVYPKAKKFTHSLKDRVYVIDLEQTRQRLAEAMEIVKAMAAEGKVILFVGTKPQAQDAVKDAATVCGMPYINQRWLGGTLTNFETILKSLNKFKRLEEVVDTEIFKEYSKKERGRLKRELEKMQRNLGGIAALDDLPDALIVVDIALEDVATNEARSTNIPVIGLLDTNANPDLITHPIPVNDDSRKAIKIVLDLLAEAIKEGKINKETPTAE